MNAASKPAALASLICPAPECRKFFTVPQRDRGTVVTCRFCGACVCVPETLQQVARLESPAPDGAR